MAFRRKAARLLDAPSPSTAADGQPDLAEDNLSHLNAALLTARSLEATMRVDVAAIEAVQERLREKRSRGGGVGGETLRDEVQQLYGTYLRMIYICDGLDTWSKVLVSHIYIYICVSRE